MPNLGFSLEMDELKSFVEDWQKAKSQPHAVPATSHTNVGNASSSLGEEENSALQILISSYLNLPDNLKACLDYCSFLNNRYPVAKDKLIRLLVAKGLIVQDDSGNLLEDIASGFVEELISLEMMKEYPFFYGEFEVRYPYRELCIKVVNRKDLVAAALGSFIDLYIFDDGKGDLSPDIESLPIQSLFVITAQRQGICKSSRLSRAYMETICKLKSLVVLDLNGNIECLPDEIGDLVHLKYLCLFDSNLKELPRTIGKLQKLQTLSLLSSRLEEIPVEVLEIQQLRHLLVSKSINNREIRVPKKVGEMKNLQTLCGVYAGGGIDNELSKLAQLLKLEILCVAADHASELFAAITKMTNLVSLSMEAEISYCEKETGSIALFPDMETFSPPPQLQDVKLTGTLVEMPNWLGTMESLTKLYLSFSYLSDNPTSEIQFLPNLTHLTLWQASKEKVIGKEFCVSGGFPKLENLTICSGFLVEWTEIANGAFPSLESLTLRNCTRLRFFPNGLEKISTLKMLLVLPIYHEDLKRRLEGEENYKIKNIPTVLLRSRVYT